MSRGLVVVGAGPAGAFAALSAAFRGEEVTLIDPRGVLGGAASRSAGVVTVQLEDPMDVRLVLRSIELIRSVAKSSALRTGFLQLGREEDLSESIAALRDAGVMHEILTGSEVVGRWPAFRVDRDLIGVYTDLDLSVEPPALGLELMEVLEAQDVRVVKRGVASFATDGNAVTGVVLEGGEKIDHDGLILAAGSHNRELLKLLGIEIRTRVITCYAYKFDLGEELEIPSFSDELLHSYWRRWGTLLVGGGYDAEWADAPDYSSAEPPAHYVRRSLEMLLQRLELRREPRYHSSLRGPCELTPDMDPYLGRLDELGDVVVVGGLRGYGLMRGPALGEAAYELLRSRGSGVLTSDELERLRPSRLLRTQRRAV
ncbi:MAG: FAD-binding oxidoreductase [Nitrososphaerota archaeon]